MNENQKAKAAAIEAAIAERYPGCTLKPTWRKRTGYWECNWPMQAAKELRQTPSAILRELFSSKLPGGYAFPGFIHIF